MLYLKYFLSSLIVYFCLSTNAYGQRLPLGTWKTHLSYQSISTLAIADQKVYAGAAGSFFYYDQSANEITRLSRIDGFSEVNISRLKYLPSHKTLLIAYQTGMIDLLRLSQKPGEADQIVPINAIRNASIPGSKTIRYIVFTDQFAYLSCDFGLVVLDVVKAEIRETAQNIGTNGTAVAVYGCTFARDSIFLATSQGVMVAPLSPNVNLQDYHNWYTFGLSQGIPQNNLSGIVHRNGKVYAAVSGTGLYTYENGTWTNLYPLTEPILNIQLAATQILISAPTRLYTLDENDMGSPINNPAIQAPMEADYDAQGKLWVADAQSGLVSNREGAFRAFIPNGPANNQAWKMYSYDNQLAVLSGGWNENTQPYNREGSLHTYDGDSWTSHTRLLNPTLPPMKDLAAAAFRPADQSLYLGSFGNGLLKKKSDGSIESVSNSPLIGTNSAVRVSGMATDADGSLWVTNHSVPFGRPSLHVLQPNDQWESVTFSQQGANFPLGILIDGNGYKWLRLDPQAGGGLLVYDDKTRQERYLSTASGNGELPNRNVRCMALDKEGQMWVGTDDGVAFFYNTESVFEGNYGAYTPIYNSQRLLNDEFITSLEVDGGNRKWIGTRNGLWLFNADGSELVAHFTTQNSPLVSNYITDIRVEPITGQVFVATDQGMLSYWGTATEAGPEHSNVKVFPNPVRPSFQGLVGITGLAANAKVKITDVAGRLVYETQANGGTATWNVRDYNGNRAETGVYLIFSSNNDGTETFVTKVAVVK